MLPSAVVSPPRMAAALGFFIAVGLPAPAASTSDSNQMAYQSIPKPDFRSLDCAGQLRIDVRAIPRLSSYGGHEARIFEIFP